VKEAPGGEHRDADEAVVALGFRHHQRRHRHFGDVELGEPQLPPEQLRGVQDGGDEVDRVRRDLPIDDRPGARIRREADAELQSHERCLLPITDAGFSRAW
jgi:hypothetical protein